MLQERTAGGPEVVRWSKSHIQMGPCCWAQLGFRGCLVPGSSPSSLVVVGGRSRGLKMAQGQREPGRDS